MEQLPENVRAIVATVRHLVAESDPQSEAVSRTVEQLREQIALLTTQVDKPTGEVKGTFGESSRKSDIEFLKNQISRLQSAAETPAKNYTRIYNIMAALQRAVAVAARPQNAAIRPRIAQIVEKVAGVFSEVDTVADISKPLEQIEKAVHGLYGEQSKNGTYYFDRRGKGHHGENKDGGAEG